MTSQIAPTAIVAKEAKLTGKVTVGSGAIIHPDATIHAAPGFEVTIGENCLIEERASILAQTKNVVVGKDSHIQVAAVVADSLIGSSCVIHPRARIEVGSKVENGSTIAPAVIIRAAEIQPNQFVTSPHLSSTIPPSQLQELTVLHSKHLEALRDLMSE